MAQRTRSGLTLSNILTPAEAESLRIQAAVVAAGLSLQPEFRNAHIEVLVATAFTRLAKCAELGLKPHLAASAMYEVHGRPAMPTAMIQSVAEASNVVDWTSEEGIDGTVNHGGRELPNHYAEVTMWLVAKPHRKHTERWDLRRGIESGYALDKSGVKSTWLANGSLLPYNRAFSHALRRVAPGITLGVYSIEEMGYQEEDLHGRNYQDPEAPIGAEKADELMSAMRVLPDASGAVDALRRFKQDTWGSPEYKLASVPVKDLPLLEAWIAETVARIGRRIGVKRADRAREQTMTALRNAGATERDADQFLREYEADCGVDRLADLTEQQEQALARRVTDWLKLAQQAGGADEAAEFVGEVLPDDPEPAPVAAPPEPVSQDAVERLFPLGDATTPQQWDVTCARQGLDGDDMAALKTQAFGSVRPPASPDEMLKLLGLTAAQVASAGAPHEGLFGP